jgi:hypothetical protein
MVPIQLDLFRSKEECEIITLRNVIEEVRKSADKVRKGTYARINELNKEQVELKSRLEIIERNICRG